MNVYVVIGEVFHESTYILGIFSTNTKAHEALTHWQEIAEAHYLDDIYIMVRKLDKVVEGDELHNI